MKNKKLLTSVVALGTAAAMVLGGTFAWQSINQTALNEASDIVNPGGRLHDDFDGADKNVYVENFADDEIFARVRLEEFFEIVLNAGTPGEKSIPMIGTKTQQLDDEGDPVLTGSGNPVYDYEYVTFKDYQSGYSTNAGIVDEYAWWTWSTGGDTVFMPTFNKNKDSLKADINGEYKFDTGVITDKDIEGGQYTTMVTYEEGEVSEANAIYDIDSNKLDEIDQEDLAALISGGTVPEAYQKNVKLLEETHTAKATSTASLMSMEDWLEAVEEFGYDEGYDTCWVYDTDGWVYWSAPIKAGEATGLLLDGIELNQVMDDSWYYAINVVAQFVTANDVGKLNDTGFYQEEDEAPSANAETLLETIGVDMSGEGGDDGDDDDSWDPGELLFSLTQRDAENAYPYSYYDESDTEGFLYDLDNYNENVFDVELGDGVTLSMSFENTRGGTSYEDGVLTLAPGDVSIITVKATYNETDYTFKLTPVYNEIVITRGDGAETRYYRIPNGAYKLTAQNFEGEVTYTVSDDAMRSSIREINGEKRLSMGGYESAKSYTVTAIDNSGNTGTVTIFPMDTHAFDGAVFWLYKDYGEYGLHGIGQLIDTQTYYWDAGDEYCVSVDLPNRPVANFTWTLTDDATGNAPSDDQIDFSASDTVLTIKCGNSLTAEDSFTLKGTSDVELPTYGDGGTAKEYTFYLNFGERPEDNGDNGGGETDPDEGESHILTGNIDTSSTNVAFYGTGRVAFYGVYYDGTQVGESELGHLYVDVYKKGETEEPVFTASEDNFYWEFSQLCFDLPMSLTPVGSTEFDVYLRYCDDNDDETTSDKMSLTYVHKEITLKAGGYTCDVSGLLEEKHCFFVLEGVDDPWNGMTASEVAGAMKVTYTELGEMKMVERDYSSTATCADWTIQQGVSDYGIIAMDRTEEDEVQAVRISTLYAFNTGITFAVTLNGTEYSVTFTPAET